jgi:DNA-binding Xre family transcriptional regulator
VRRDEFGQIDEKTIARIERGEVKRPRRVTLEAIAARLGVSVEDIETY